MGSFGNFFKTVLLPALISFSIYFTLSFVIIPLYRRHRERYAQYLPLATMSHHAESLRSRVISSISRWVSRRMSTGHYEIADAEGSLFDEEEGEGLVGFPFSAGGRHQLGPMDNDQSVPRLSRDLEEGFQDESDDESDRGNRTPSLR